ncbi:hypothetical protein Y032_0072g627 [Ancylostoma ceylanicum]|uniref:Uncharacterized protein n=1 Tax=Ancylostoma ceylanicum TaxID=53326 RepID=A0A016TW30_9BILA|nr:hypothetical protein Y032_0072g627 [Ancylostoma ceylanicum]
MTNLDGKLMLSSDKESPPGCLGTTCVFETVLFPSAPGEATEGSLLAETPKRCARQARKKKPQWIPAYPLRRIEPVSVHFFIFPSNSTPPNARTPLSHRGECWDQGEAW